MVVPLVALSLAVNKLPHYLLPVTPFLAVWLGRAADARLGQAATDRVGRITGAVGAVAGAAALVAIGFAAAHTGVSAFLPEATQWALGAAAVAFVSLGLAGALGRRRLAWAGLAVLALALRLGLDASLLPFVDARTLERPLAAAVRDNLPHGGVAIAHRWWRASFVAYGVRGWERTGSPAELASRLAAAARTDRTALVLARSDSEGEVRAVVWNAGGVAREVARVTGLGEIDGKVLEGVDLPGGARNGTRRDGSTTPTGRSPASAASMGSKATPGRHRSAGASPATPGSRCRSNPGARAASSCARGALPARPPRTPSD